MLKFVVISESDIFGGEKKKKKRKRIYEGEKIASFTDLNIGDYVVHESHGLGIYRGIEKIEVDKTEKDYIKIEYAGRGQSLHSGDAAGADPEICRRGGEKAEVKQAWRTGVEQDQVEGQGSGRGDRRRPREALRSAPE